MGHYAYYNITVHGPNELLQSIKTNVFKNSSHHLYSNDAIDVEGDTLTTNTYWKLRDRDEQFNQLISDHPELTVSISGYCNDGEVFSWEETYSAEDGHFYKEVDLEFRHSITFECKHDGILLYNLDRSLAVINAIAKDVVVEDNVIRFTTYECFSFEDELDFIVDAEIYYHYEIIGGSDAAIGHEGDYSDEFSYSERAALEAM
jgi:hypothetical protein